MQAIMLHEVKRCEICKEPLSIPEAYFGVLNGKLIACHKKCWDKEQEKIKLKTE